MPIFALVLVDCTSSGTLTLY